MEKENQPNNPNPVQPKLASSPTLDPGPIPPPLETQPKSLAQLNPRPSHPALSPAHPPFAPRARPTHSPRTTSAQNASPFPTCQRPRALPATPGPRVSGSPFPFLSLSAAQRRGRDHRRVRRDLYPAAPRRDPRNPPIFGPCDPLFPIPASQRRPTNPSRRAAHPRRAAPLLRRGRAAPLPRNPGRAARRLRLDARIFPELFPSAPTPAAPVPVLRRARRRPPSTPAPLHTVTARVEPQ